MNQVSTITTSDHLSLNLLSWQRQWPTLIIKELAGQKKEAKALLVCLHRVIINSRSYLRLTNTLKMYQLAMEAPSKTIEQLIICTTRPWRSITLLVHIHLYLTVMPISMALWACPVVVVPNLEVILYLRVDTFQELTVGICPEVSVNRVGKDSKGSPIW